MLPQQRRERILTVVRSMGAVRIVDLVTELDVSEMTIRRDVNQLASRGQVRRVHGGVVSNDPTSFEPGFEAKATLARGEKAAIATAAAELVGPGDCIALSAGTTTHLLARQLAARTDLGRLTVVTNSLPVVESFRGSDWAEVILTGGSPTPSDAFVGPLAVSVINQLRVDQLFLGVHGIDARAGLTTPNVLEGETNRALLAAASRLVVVADSTKWGTIGLSKIVALNAVDVLITDKGLSEEDAAQTASLVGQLKLVDSDATS